MNSSLRYGPEKRAEQILALLETPHPHPPSLVQARIPLRSLIRFSKGTLTFKHAFQDIKGPTLSQNINNSFIYRLLLNYISFQAYEIPLDAHPLITNEQQYVCMNIL